MDDGSTDQTAEIARRFASKQVAVVSTENRGAAAARNHALQLSQGDYIQWLDADDLLAPDKIERQLAALREVENRRILQPCNVRRMQRRCSPAQACTYTLTFFPAKEPPRPAGIYWFPVGSNSGKHVL